MRKNYTDPSQRQVRGADNMVIHRANNYNPPDHLLKFGTLKGRKEVRLSDGSSLYIRKGKSVKQAVERYEKHIAGLDYVAGANGKMILA